nr:muconolactone Delta-isomerase [uncultured Celeribacter sp.]
MLYHVSMTVNLPVDMDPDVAAEIKAREKAYSQELQHQGIWRHIWRVAGLYENVSIFDCRDNEHLHEVLMGLPLYPYMDISVTPLCRHPSSVHEDDA